MFTNIVSSHDTQFDDDMFDLVSVLIKFLLATSLVKTKTSCHLFCIYIKGIDPREGGWGE